MKLGCQYVWDWRSNKPVFFNSLSCSQVMAYEALDMADGYIKRVTGTLYFLTSGSMSE
ncbi:hypothetical protein MBAV_002924 [Candidatus Magnetobacterium bavaricum]|uniref:Uncharacterized protein n=1 Tax=Candidatus Magnetobacterium bavaricum TaxID=29290 RepID=A0A0F3GSS9_9BACT|nr:hypothetical protein MBAV_002924 [Candidatus Magnetobacterium bavaricum]